MMKEYKVIYGNNIFFSNTLTYYILNKKYHGFYYSMGYKGYYNMDEEYSHWLENHNEFKYYL